MKKGITLISLLLIVVALSSCLVACSVVGEMGKKQDFSGITFLDLTVEYDGQEHTILCENVPSGAEVVYENNSATKDGVYEATATVTKEGYNTLVLEATLTITLTEEMVVAARQKAAGQREQNYDFNFKIAGQISAGDYAGDGEGNCNGMYRYDADSGELAYKNVTGGNFLNTATYYVHNQGENRIQLQCNQKGEVKKVTTVTEEKEELAIINLPFVAVADGIDTDILSDITGQTNEGYEYKGKLALDITDENLQEIVDVMIYLVGRDIVKEEVELSDPSEGVDFYFSLTEDRTEITAFRIGIKVKFPVEAVYAELELTYSQSASDVTFNVPSTAGVISDKAMIANEMTKIDDAFTAVKNSRTYSLDFEASNEFDPAWNISATKNEYLARLYKNTYGDRVDFNHSFEYWSYNELGEKTEYEHTYGNLLDGSVWHIARRGTNVITAADGVTADTQFDYLADLSKIAPEGIDCINKTEKNGSTVYSVAIAEDMTLAIIDRIVDMLDGNPATDIVEINNYFNDVYKTLDATMVVEVREGKLVSVKITTDLAYYPTGGEYSDMEITLTNVISLVVNENIDSATEYVAPATKENELSGFGLNSAKYYIR